MICTIQKTVNKILTDHPPKCLLCIGRETAESMQEYLSRHPDCTMLQIDCVAQNFINVMKRLSTQRVFDFGIVAGTIEHLDKSLAKHLLARLRDIHTKKLLVAVPMGDQWTNHSSHWQEMDLLALGFIVKAKLTIDAKPVHIYAFDIDSYKTTPDWLNNKYWANPHLWDKYWW